MSESKGMEGKEVAVSKIDLPAMQSRKLVRGSLVWWLRFLGAAGIIVILLQLPGPKDIQLVQIDLRWLGFCMLLTILKILLEGFVWQWMLFIQHIPHPYPQTLLSYLASQYLGLVTPGHVGEFLAAGYVSSNTGITMGYALSGVVMTKVLGWITVMGFGIWGMQLLPEIHLLQGVGWAVAASIIVFIAFSLGIGVWVLSLRRLTRKWEKFSPWQIDLIELRAGIRKCLTIHLVFPLCIAIIAFGILFLQLDFVLRALGLSIPFLLVAQIVAFSRIVGRIVPLSVVGFGSKDAAVIGMLSLHGVDPSTGLTATLLFLMCSYVVTLLLSGLCWWIKPLVLRRPAKGGNL